MQVFDPLLERQVDTFQYSVQLCQINMCGIIHWLRPTRILDHSCFFPIRPRSPRSWHQPRRLSLLPAPISLHQSPLAGSYFFTLAMVSVTIRTSKVSVVSSSQPLLTILAQRFIVLAATRSHLHTGKCPTSLPHWEETARHVKLLSTSRTAFPRLYCKVPCSTWTSKSNTQGSIFQPFWVLTNQTKLDQFRSNMQWRHNMFVHINVVKVRRRLPSTFSSWDNTALIIVFIIAVPRWAQSQVR